MCQHTTRAGGRRHGPAPQRRRPLYSPVTVTGYPFGGRGPGAGQQQRAVALVALARPAAAALAAALALICGYMICGMICGIRSTVFGIRYAACIAQPRSRESRVGSGGEAPRLCASNMTSC